MIFSKGGAETEDTVLFGKYQICRTIGHGRSGTVFLARHLVLEEYRAVKCVPRDAIGENSLIREAMLLKTLRHPGIPIIYDLEQDEHFYYLIEEYLRGESLYALVKRQGCLSGAETVSYGIRLCQIVKYLHSLKPNPILYLDLQPKNIIICDGALKLIDFDQAVPAFSSHDLKRRYGTVGCAAPEQFSNEPLDVRTDVYAIGSLLHFMGTGTFPGGIPSALASGLSEELTAVIAQCLRPSKAERYADMDGILEDLFKLKPGVFPKNQISLLKIAVIGSSPGAGTIHPSFDLSFWLSRRGISNLYTECGKGGHVMRLAEYEGLSPDPYGVFHVRGLNLRPCYGRCVRLDQPDFDVLIEDFGTDFDMLPEETQYHLILLICSGQWWERADCVRALHMLSGRRDLRVLILPSPAKQIRLPAVFSRIPCFRLPPGGEADTGYDGTSRFWTAVLEGTSAGEALLNRETEKKQGSIFSVKGLSGFLKKGKRTFKGLREQQ